MASPLEGGKGSASRLYRSLPKGLNPVPILQKAVWAPEPVWTSAENLASTGIPSPELPVRRVSVYWPSYPGPRYSHGKIKVCGENVDPVLILLPQNSRGMTWKESGIALQKAGAQPPVHGTVSLRLWTLCDLFEDWLCASRVNQCVVISKTSRWVTHEENNTPIILRIVQNCVNRAQKLEFRN